MPGAKAARAFIGKDWVFMCNICDSMHTKRIVRFMI